MITVVPHSTHWQHQFRDVAAALRRGLLEVPSARVEHVGSTAVPGLAAKPILDIDVIVSEEDVAAGLVALTALGYRSRGDLGVSDRIAFHAPDDDPQRHVYLCTVGTLHVRNHLAVRSVLRARADLRDEYGAVKLSLAADPAIDMATYIARKSAVLQKVLAASDLTESERLAILRLNDPPPPGEV